MTTIISKGAGEPVFRRTSTGSWSSGMGRDMVMLAMWWIIISAVVWLVGSWLGLLFSPLPIITGTATGMTVVYWQWRPVHGVVPARGRTVVLAQLADSGLVPAAGAAGEERFVDKRSRWTAWSSNSATLRRRQDGDFDATLPRHVHAKIKRRSVPS